MEKAGPPVTKRSLYSWVFSDNYKLQILLVIIIIITVLVRVLPLEMQKRIVNEAINLRKIDLLFFYCGLYLAAVVVAGGLKYLINALQTLIGQRVSARMRKELYGHILTLPLGFFRKTQPGMVVSSLITELAAAGDFAGNAVAVPVTSILTLIAFAGYLVWLNPILGFVSLSIYPVVLFLLPLLQKRANTANKKRVDTTRDLASKIAESITGIHEIQSNGAFGIENRKYGDLVDKLMKIRIVWNLYRYGIKTSNNFFSSLSPFLIFILGGYLAINGRLELGALVAFLSAQEKLYDPWKELIEFYQAYQDSSVGYYRTMEYFDFEPEYALEPEDREPYQLEGSIEVKDLSFTVEGGIRLLDGITFSMKPGENLALVGFSGSGKSTLAQCLNQLYKYTGGHVWIGGKEVSELSKRDIVYNTGFVAQAPFIFSGTFEENLLYSCMARNRGSGTADRESLPTLDEMIEILQQTGIFVDVLRFGLNAFLVPDQDEELVYRIVRVREKFQRNFGEALADSVEFFDENKYLYYSNIFENITFGTPKREVFGEGKLLRSKYFRQYLEDVDLYKPLFDLGDELAKTVVDILGDLPPDEIFFEQSPIRPDELDGYKALVDRLRKRKHQEISSEDKEKLLALALRFTPGRHKIAPFSEMLENLILESRALFREKISDFDPEAVSFFRKSDYIYSQTLMNNILFGKTKTGAPHALEEIDRNIVQVLVEEDLLETVVKTGMQYQVGSKGDKLSGGQRQKLAIARTFLKAPPVLILDEATSALDNKSQARIQSVIETRWKGRATVIAVAHRLDTIKNFHRVAVLKAGKIVEIGPYDELMAGKGMLYELATGKR